MRIIFKCVNKFWSYTVEIDGVEHSRGGFSTFLEAASAAKSHLNI